MKPLLLPVCMCGLVATWPPPEASRLSFPQHEAIFYDVMLRFAHLSVCSLNLNLKFIVIFKCSCFRIRIKRKSTIEAEACP